MQRDTSKQHTAKTVYVGLSGGVDSAVAALLLQKQGYTVVGVTLQLVPTAGHEVADARAVADALGIAHRVVDLQETFAQQVVSYFVNTYRSGKTPNPCVVCNRTIKFGALLEYALEQGADYLATGHYARIEQENGRYLLKRSQSGKDQSYFLHQLSQAQLSRVLFPLESLEKADTRALAREHGLPVAQKRDSQEICFVPDDDYVAFLEQRMEIPPEPGAFLDAEGAVIGKHKGILHYTIGQRKGLGAFGKPMYVTAIDAAENTVTLGEAGQEYATGLLVGEMNWIAIPPPEKAFAAQVKVRFRANAVLATVTPKENGQYQIMVSQPVRSVTPGQFAVLYDADTMLGGGVILRSI